MHIHLIDANALFNCHYGKQPTLQNSGSPFLEVLSYARNLLNSNPEMLNIFLWDGRAQWRLDLFPTYTRDGSEASIRSPEEYHKQLALLKVSLEALPIIQVHHPAAEAGDLAFGLSRQMGKQGHLVTQSTSDPNWLQNVDRRIQWKNLQGSQQLVELEGFARSSGGFQAPSKVAVVRALTRHLFKDVEHAPSLTHKQANALIGKYQTLDTLLAAASNFLAFSSEEATFAHTLTSLEVQEQVRKNFSLIALDKGPPLLGRDCLVVEGEGAELDLYELFFNLGVELIPSQISLWKRACDIQLESVSPQALSRALSALETSWRDSVNV